jgi:predicted Zn-dependent protease
MHRALERIKNIERFGREPETKAERLYAEADRHERFGSLNIAWSLYEKLVATTPTDKIEDRAYVNLARQAIRRVKAQAALEQDPSAFVIGKLDAAKKLMDQGRAVQARHVLDEIMVLYANDQNLKTLVDKARVLLRQIDALGTAGTNRE